MKRFKITLLALCTIVAFSCKENTNKSSDAENGEEMNQESADQKEMDQEAKEKKMLVINLEPKSGSNLSGEATFTEDDGEVTMKATIKGLAEGKHAIHIHEKADCSAEDGTSAGGHWNPTGQPHGKWGDEAGYHKGDIGNFTVEDNGTGTVEMTTDEWCIGCEDDTKNIVGKAIIIHDGVDDFTSQPSGAAGTRVGCGVIKM
ncbi:superoxide dismutase family protein [Gangjinia marincola]|uniref:Superoxide dismutase family protein n=1 Tax=Gangjinia marincola TaxID=578463 RepID=A0ABN1MG85_9FLAO